MYAEIPNLHNFSAYFVASSVAARFFAPQVARAVHRPELRQCKASVFRHLSGRRKNDECAVDINRVQLPTA